MRRNMQVVYKYGIMPALIPVYLHPVISDHDAFGRKRRPGQSIIKYFFIRPGYHWLLVITCSKSAGGILNFVLYRFKSIGY